MISLVNNHDQQDGFIFCYKEYTKAKLALEMVKEKLDKSTKTFVEQLELGECQFSEINGQEVIEPYWLLVLPRPGKMHELDDWVCTMNFDADEMFCGLTRVFDYKIYTKTIEMV